MKKNIIRIAGIGLTLSLGCVALAGMNTYASRIEAAEAAASNYTLRLSSEKNHIASIAHKGTATVQTDLGNDIKLFFL